MPDLAECRARIDRIDTQIRELFLERMETAEKIGTYKASRGMPVLDARREQEKIDSVRAAMPTPFLADGAERIIRLLMELSRMEQETLPDQKGREEPSL